MKNVTRLGIVALWMGSCLWAAPVDESRGSLVRVRASIQPYDQFRPWQKKAPLG